MEAAEFFRSWQVRSKLNYQLLAVCDSLYPYPLLISAYSYKLVSGPLVTVYVIQISTKFPSTHYLSLT